MKSAIFIALAYFIFMPRLVWLIDDNYYSNHGQHGYFEGVVYGLQGLFVFFQTVCVFLICLVIRASLQLIQLSGHLAALQKIRERKEASAAPRSNVTP
jgi:hypothetical protein